MVEGKVIDIVAEEVDHSPMGGSKAEAFIECPGSVSLGQGLPDLESKDAQEGTLAHALAAECLQSGKDAWNYLDDKKGITKDMTDAVQVYLDDIKSFEFQAKNAFIEHEFACPDLHKHFRGVLDFAALRRDTPGTLYLWDYKHGVGILVEVEDNAQLKYYGTGMILDLKKNHDISIDKVVFTIAQPRGFHSDGPIRRVEYTKEELFDWATTTLIPAMERAEKSNETKSGEWCRFCPVRFRDCPAHREDMNELAVKTYLGQEGVIDKISELSEEQIGRYLKLAEKVNIIKKAMETVAFQRAMAGKKIPGKKLVHSFGNRKWKDEAEAELKKKYKDQAYQERKLLSPSQIEKLPEGKKFASQYSFKPAKSLSLVDESHKSPAVSMDTKKLFTPVKEKV